MNTFYNLCKWGLGLKIAQHFFEQNIFVEDYIINKDLCFEDYYNMNKIKEIFFEIGIENALKKTIYDLCCVGLSHNLATDLDKRNITLEMVLDEQSKNKVLNKLNPYNHSLVIEAVEKYKNFKCDTNTFLLHSLIRLFNSGSVSFIEAKNSMEKIDVYPIENFYGDIEKLKNNGKINVDNDTIILKLPNIIECVNTLSSEKTKNTTLSFLQGYSYKGCCEMYDSVLNSTYQKINATLDMYHSVFELKHEEEFRKYHYDLSSTLTLLNLDTSGYFYLDTKFGIGKLGLFEKFYQDISLEDKNFLYNHNALLCMNDFYKLNLREISLRHYLSINCLEATDLEIAYAGYTSYLQSIGLEEINYNTAKILEFHVKDSPVAIQCKDDKIRYYDFSLFTDSDCYNLSLLFNQLDGYYTTRALFRNHPNLMARYDIRDEYELYSVLTKLKTRVNPTYKRDIDFIIGNVSRDEFIHNTIQFLGSTTKENLKQYIYDENGLDPVHYGIHLKIKNLNRKSEVLTGSNINYEIFLADIIDEMSQFDCICLKTFYELIKNRIKEFNQGMISLQLIDYLGYYYENGVIINKNIPNIREYLKGELLKDPSYFERKINDIGSLLIDVVSELESNYDLVMYSAYKYYSISDLKEKGISKDDIYNFIDEVYNLDNYFIYDETLLDSLKENNLISKNLGIQFYKSILHHSKKFYYSRIRKLNAFIANNKFTKLPDLYVKIAKSLVKEENDKYFRELEGYADVIEYYNKY